MIISRYLIKEVVNTLLAVTLVLLLIFLSQQLVRYLSYAASGKIAVNLLFQLLGFEIPFLLAVLLPLGLYLGIILTYGRLYADNELRVLHACGYSRRRLVVLTGGLAIIVALVVLGLTTWANPHIAAAKQKSLQRSSGIDSILDVLMPGRFQVSEDGRRVVYVEKISRDHREADNLFIADQGKNTSDQNVYPWTVLSAEHGYQMQDKATHDHFVVATNGYRYAGVPGQNDYKITQFKKYAVRTPDVSANSQRQIDEAIPTSKLFRTYHEPNHAAELQWRLSMPLSAFLLALLAVPLSQVRPRQGRFMMLLPAVLIYIVYINLLFAGRNLIELSKVPVVVGLWWVHLLVLVFAVVLFSEWRVRNQ